jgi:hypothetical protein
MEVLFRCLVVVALALGVTALVGQPDAPEVTRSERDPDDVRRIAALEDRVRTLESRDVAPAPATPADGVARSTELAAETALAAAIDSRLDERMVEFRENLVKEYRLGEAGSDLRVAAKAKPKTLEEIGEEVGLNGNEIDFIRTEREAAEREIMEILKDEGESDEAFELRIKDLADDPEAQTAAMEKIMTKIMAGGGLGKMMAIQAKHERAIRERIGNDRYKKYKALEGGLRGGNSMSLGIKMGMDTSDEER